MVAGSREIGRDRRGGFGNGEVVGVRRGGFGYGEVAGVRRVARRFGGLNRATNALRVTACVLSTPLLVFAKLGFGRVNSSCIALFHSGRARPK